MIGQKGLRHFKEETLPLIEVYDTRIVKINLSLLFG